MERDINNFKDILKNIEEMNGNDSNNEKKDIKSLKDININMVLKGVVIIIFYNLLNSIFYGSIFYFFFLLLDIESFTNIGLVNSFLMGFLYWNLFGRKIKK